MKVELGRGSPPVHHTYIYILLFCHPVNTWTNLKNLVPYSRSIVVFISSPCNYACFILIGDWKGTLRFLSDGDCSLGGSLLWLKPDLSTLRWLARLLTTQLDVDRVFSVGCGSGLLEWLLSCTSGIHSFFYLLYK